MTKQAYFFHTAANNYKSFAPLSKGKDKIDIFII